jgi:AmiR/NasT family two-component response regulator
MAAQTRLSDQLRQALESRAVIDQAIGAIMTQQRCSAEQAFAVLRATSQNRNIKLRTVAADIVASIQQHAPHQHPDDGHPDDGHPDDGTGPVTN